MFSSDNAAGIACLKPWANYNAPDHVITETKTCVLNKPPSTVAPPRVTVTLRLRSSWHHRSHNLYPPHYLGSRLH